MRIIVTPGVPQPDGPRPPAYRLTPRELDILNLLVEGLTDVEIAAELSTGASTVKNHVASVLGKLGARNRTHAAALAVSAGLVDVRHPPGRS